MSIDFLILATFPFPVSRTPSIPHIIHNSSQVHAVWLFLPALVSFTFLNLTAVLSLQSQALLASIVLLATKWNIIRAKNDVSAFKLYCLQTKWPRGLTRRFASARLLRLCVRIPPGAWMLVSCECCVLSGRVLCDQVITRPEESYRLWCVVVCDLEMSWIRKPWPTGGCRVKNMTEKAIDNISFRYMGTMVAKHGNISFTKQLRAQWMTEILATIQFRILCLSVSNT